MSKKEHRGRIQAQGEGLEASESWAQDEPLTAKKGLWLLRKLKNKIPKSEVKKREKEFAKAENLIKRARKIGGIDAKYSQSFRKKESDGVRVDIEVQSGQAFIAVIIFIFALLWLLLK